METLTRDELIVELAKDYGVRAKVLGLKFEEAYAKYVKRCSLRTYENLLQQFTIGNLSDPVKIKPKLRSNEYIVSAPADDDCEDGVCKL